MANNSMGTKKVEELLVSKSMPLGMQFYVPNYQRGYRWKESQVQQLLNDIKEFDYEKNNEKKFYCLQPLVVTEDKENGWVVIDGQQRLTTLFIILTCIEKMLYKEKAQLYQMNYQNKPQMHDWLEELGDVNNDVQINSDDIDAYHITNAYLTVKAWLEEANDLKAIGAEIREKNDKYVGINRNIANVLRRALLCKGDYTLFHSSNSSFLIDNDRDISWKRLLRIQSNEKNGTYQNRRKMFFSLIKDPLFDQNDIADSLQKICDRDVAGITDWRKYFITVPEIMDSLHKYTDGRASERYVRFEGKYIFLMGSTRLYGWNEEYYSYALYCLLKKLPNASVKYNQAKGWEDVDCHIELTSSTNAGKWKIKYLRAKDKFSVIDASGVQSLYSTVEDAKYALEKLL